jgi:zinc/manganese transport system substrate-binding protein
MSKKIVVLALSLVFPLVLLTSCSGGNSSSQDDGKLKIISSISNWGSLAKDVGGDLVTVENIIDGTNSPSHEFEPTTQQIAEFSTAKIILINGVEYDNWAVQAAKNATASDSSIKVINVGEVVGAKEDANPHLWNNTEYIAQAQDKIYETLKSVLPQSDYDTLDQNQSATKDKLYALNEKLASIYREIKGKTFVKTESVLDYLMEGTFGLKDVTPADYKNAVQNEGEPSATAISNTEKVLKSGDVSYLVFNEQEQPSYVSQIVEAANDKKVKVIAITELMPSNFTDVYDWLSDVASKVSEK